MMNTNMNTTETKNNLLRIITQAFYGNRTATEVNESDIDAFILGYTDNSLTISEEIDRTIIHVPDNENIVLIYNKYQEESYANSNDKPLVSIPEIGLTLYSRCIACRMNDNGQLESLHNEDCEIILKYFAE